MLIWKQYYEYLILLQIKDKLILTFIPYFESNNAHMFYKIYAHLLERTHLINYLKNAGINAEFHYQS